MSTKHKIYNEGYQARNNGEHYSNCPYPTWSEEHEWWQEGFFDAKYAPNAAHY